MERFLLDLGVIFRDDEFSFVIPKKLGIDLKKQCIVDFSCKVERLTNYDVYKVEAIYTGMGDTLYMDWEGESLWSDAKRMVIDEISTAIKNKLLGE